MNSTSAVALSNLQFRYHRDLPLVLDIPEWVVTQGERTFLHGPSGSGKTTLLGLIAGILEVQTGNLQVLAQDYHRLRGRARDRFRGEHLGYIFQMFNLIPYLSVRDNICLPCRLSRARLARTHGGLESSVTELAERLGIMEWLNRPVTSLSVGQQQRVAAARALIGSPELIIADEPTSALDTGHREAFIKLLFDEAARTGATVLFVSHDHALSSMFDARVSLCDLNRADGSAKNVRT